MNDAPAFRLRVLAVVLVSLLVTLAARMWYLQVLNGQEFEEVATELATETVTIQAPRGRILDVNSRVLVDNRQTTAVTVDINVLQDALPVGAERTAMLTRLAVLVNDNAEQELVKVTDLEDRIVRGSDTRYDNAILALDVDPSLLVYLGEHRDEFPGIEVTQTVVRDYPYGNLAAHVLGYVGAITQGELDVRNLRFGAPDPTDKIYAPSDEIGKTGIEAIFEDDLRGIPGQRVYEVDVSGNVIREILAERRDPVPGSDVVLTIDIDLQALVEEELVRSLELARSQEKDDPTDPDFVAPAGAAVVLDPRDGTVRAMASYPTYDPESFIGGISQVEFDALRSPAAHAPILNRAIQAAYPPGSTFKLITAYAAMRTGLLDAIYPRGWQEAIDHGPVYTLISCETQAEAVDTCRFRNSEEAVYTGIDLPRSLTVSSDSYYYRIGEEFFIRTEFDDEEIQYAARDFGMGSPSGVALLTEGPGLVPDAELYRERFADSPHLFARGDWFPGDTVNLAIGQGEMLTTPLQLANAYATFANGGTRYAPNVAARVVDSDGNVVREFAPRVAGTVDLPPEIRDPILSGLVGVTSDTGGTAFEAFNLPGEGIQNASHDIFGWPVAGKTGTAEKDGKADIAWFAAFGPTPNVAAGTALDSVPAYAMAIVLEESGFASRTAAPMAGRLFQAISEDRVPPAPTAAELAQCDDFLFELEQALEAEESGTTTTTTTVPGATTTTSPPAVAEPPVDAARLAAICEAPVPDQGEDES